ncbi:MAG: ATP-binding cassette domain-containing protein [Promicromonosporaceae bacterium]|jgi:ABC-2 type transport system ATP-binding protein|nr:ATP-binding cassette domain-containing protein [Promicromonosporaceae bacterium]
MITDRLSPRGSSTGESPTALSVRNLTVGYGRQEVLHGVSLRMAPGVHGLLGPNGAGKSTLFAALVGLMKPRGGSVTFEGPATDGAPSIGYLPQRFDLIGSLSALEHVEFAAWTNGVEAAACTAAARVALAAVDLDDRAGVKAKRLSGGQRQRLGIACALAHDPAVVLLDEPSVGLDPMQRTQLRHNLDALGESRIVLVSTHLVEDLAQLADSVFVMLDGRIAFDGTVEELSALVPMPSSRLSPLEAGYRAIALGLEA